MFLDSVFAHLARGAQVTDEFVYAFVVEMVELNPLALCFEVLAKGLPLLHGTDSPLAVNALLFDEAVEVREDVLGFLDGNHAVDGVFQLLLDLFGSGLVGKLLLIFFKVLADGGEAVVDGCALDAF